MNGATTTGNGNGDEMKPLTDLTESGAGQLDEIERLMGRGTADARTRLDEQSGRLDSLNDLSVPRSNGSRGKVAAPAEPPIAETVAEEGPLPPITDPVPSQPEAQENYPALTGSKEEIAKQCAALLAAGEVEHFNAVRPAGPIDLRGIDLTGMDLTGVDLRHADLTRAILTGANLTAAKLQHAVIDRADLSDTVLKGAQFYQASLRYTDLRNVREAAGAEFHEAMLRGAELDGGNFRLAIFADAKLISASLTDAKFQGAQMERTYLPGAILTRASFEGANLHKARLFQSNGEDINFKGANLTGAEAIQTYYRSSNAPSAEGAKLRTSFEGAWIRGLRRDERLTDEILAGSISDRLPQEGTFASTPAPHDQKILVDGIPGTDKVLFDAAMEELNELIGLHSVKEYVRELISVLKASKARKQQGLPELDITLHRAYTGDAGTGKTTIARIGSKLLHSLGFLAKGHLVETDKSGLIAGYQGQTLGKTQELVDSAMGGTLVIDEAYALTNSDNDSYAKDALAVLTKRLEDDRDKFCCIVCGYTKEMRAFIKANSGLTDRFDEFVEFPSYTSGELIDIMTMRLDKKRYRADAEFLATSSALFAALQAKQERNFANGRTVRKAVEKMGVRLARRVDREGKLGDRKALLTPTIEDLPFNSMLGFGRDILPPLSELRWEGPGGKELTVNELSTEGPFPCLTKESAALVAKRYRAAHDERESRIASEETAATAGERAA